MPPSRSPGSRLCQISSDCCRTASTWSSTARAAAKRAGLVAAALLMSLGQPQQEAMTAIRAHRPKAFTLACHRQWLDGLAARLAEGD